jgi:predicted lysophospholipase L1 biosynthesis ABC-type transport system permease subunit
MSLVEATANVVVGFGVAVLAQVAVFPLFGLHVGFADNLMIAAIFTAISIARFYVLRRVFEAIRVHRNEKTAAGR